MKIFVVIPAYNEEKSIERVVLEVKKYIPNIVIVNDCSSDNTEREAKKSGAVVLNHTINRGQGAALQTGNEYALQHGADIIVHFDADGQHQTKDLQKMIDPILNGEADVVLGSRFLGNNANEQKIPLTKRLIILKIARLVNRFFTGLKLTDGHNGWRVLSESAAQKINIVQDRMAHNTEIPQLINKYKLRYKEVSVDIVYNEYGQGLWDGIKIMWDIVKDKFIR